MFTGLAKVKQVFAAAMALPLLATLAGCDSGQHIGVGSPPPSVPAVTVKGLPGVKAPYGTANVTAYSLVTFSKEALGLERDLKCIQINTGTSGALTCPDALNRTEDETMKKELTP